MKCFSCFFDRVNKQIESEQGKIAEKIRADFSKEIELLESGAKHEDPNNKEYIIDLQKTRLGLILEKSFAHHKAEQIVRERLQLKVAYYTMVVSVFALFISLISLFFR